MPDSPESPGFFDATKNTQARTAAADNKKNPAATVPPREIFSESIILPPNGLVQWCQYLASLLRTQEVCADTSGRQV